MYSSFYFEMPNRRQFRSKARIDIDVSSKLSAIALIPYRVT